VSPQTPSTVSSKFILGSQPKISIQKIPAIRTMVFRYIARVKRVHGPFDFEAPFRLTVDHPHGHLTPPRIHHKIIRSAFGVPSIRKCPLQRHLGVKINSWGSGVHSWKGLRRRHPGHILSHPSGTFSGAHPLHPRRRGAGLRVVLGKTPRRPCRSKLSFSRIRPCVDGCSGACATQNARGRVDSRLQPPPPPRRVASQGPSRP